MHGLRVVQAGRLSRTRQAILPDDGQYALVEVIEQRFEGVWFSRPCRLAEHYHRRSLFSTYFTSIAPRLADYYWLVHQAEGALTLNVDSAFEDPSQWWYDHVIPWDGISWFPLDDERPESAIPDRWILLDKSFFPNWIDLMPDAEIQAIGFRGENQLDAVQIARAIVARSDRFFDRLYEGEARVGDETDAIEALTEVGSMCFVNLDPGWEFFSKDESLLEKVLVEIGTVEPNARIERVPLEKSDLFAHLKKSTQRTQIVSTDS